MAENTDFSIQIDAPLQLVWDTTNDVRQWPELFTEYAAAEILEESDDYVLFRLTMHPDENDIKWSWVSERKMDANTHVVYAKRVETGPFEYMNIVWDYTADSNSSTTMRWRQDFHMKAGAPVDDATMANRIRENTPIQMEHIKKIIEESYQSSSSKQA